MYCLYDVKKIIVFLYFLRKLSECITVLKKIQCILKVDFFVIRNIISCYFFLLVLERIRTWTGALQI